MKVMLIKDVYKIGRAGDVKNVSNGYGRNYLLPQGLAVLATPSTLKQADYIRKKANAQREVLNSEMIGLFEQLSGIVLTFSSKAGETGKLYGSITSQMIVDKIMEDIGIPIDRRKVEMSPIRTIGENIVHIHLTVDLSPEVKIIVNREGEAIAITPDEILIDNKSEVSVIDAENHERFPEKENGEVKDEKAE